MIVGDVPVAVVSAVVNQQILILIAGGLVIMAAASFRC
jgi:methyl-accepting chemotaxis protein